MALASYQMQYRRSINSTKERLYRPILWAEDAFIEDKPDKLRAIKGYSPILLQKKKKKTSKSGRRGTGSFVIREVV